MTTLLLVAALACALGLVLGLWLRGWWHGRKRTPRPAPASQARAVQVVLLDAAGIAEHSRRTMHVTEVPAELVRPHGRQSATRYRFSHEADGRVFYRQVA